jgi:hypothetical protein
MPIVAFSRIPETITTSGPAEDERILIQVSDAVARRIVQKVGGRQGMLTGRHLPRLLALASLREFDSDLKLLTRALEAEGQLFVRLM